MHAICHVNVNIRKYIYVYVYICIYIYVQIKMYLKLRWKSSSHSGKFSIFIIQSSLRSRLNHLSSLFLPQFGLDIPPLHGNPSRLCSMNLLMLPFYLENQVVPVLLAIKPHVEKLQSAIRRIEFMHPKPLFRPHKRIPIFLVRRALGWN